MNDRPNYGVGGTNLTETGYDSQRYDNSLHLSDVTMVSAHLMHEARLGLRWDGQTNTPNSTAPQVQVSGAFTGGGSTVGMQRERELNTEIDDDAILTTKNHTVKFGTFLMLYRERQQEPANFNGTYMFQDLAHYAAGVPETYTAVTGTPTVNFTEVEDALFVQDDWNVGHGVHIAGGLRYFWQTQPTTLGSIDPRLGVVWAPGKKPTWTLHAHAGLFASQMSPEVATQVREQDGVQRVTSTVYNPVYGAPFSGGPAVIHTERAFSPHITNLTWGGENVGGTKSLPKGWNLSLDYYFGRIWNDMRSENINSPLNGSPTGPRPGQPNLNVLQVQNSGQGNIGATFAGVEQHSLKHVQFFFGGVRVRLIDDTDDNEFFTPQSAFNDAGEVAPRSGQGKWQVFGNATITLPAKVQLSLNGNASGDAHYNITTGFDNNGDGDFNDRPQYALPGQAGAVQTPYGLLVATGGTGVLRRNLGQMPWVYYIDANVQRTFALTNDAKAEHPQTLTVNVRSSNVINHTNVTSVGGVLGSPLFGVGYAADPSRRVELGARYSF